MGLSAPPEVPPVWETPLCTTPECSTADPAGTGAEKKKKGKVSQNLFDLAMNCQAFQPLFRGGLREGAGLCCIRRHL